MKQAAQRLGREAEERAAALLSGHGLVSVTRNFRCRGGEIDLVMRDGPVLVFVEVRYRNSTRFGGAMASVTATKRRRLITAARQYLARTGWEGPCRFDVVGFDRAEGQWIRDAFAV